MTLSKNTQHDLQRRDESIMDTVASGRSFIVTRDGHQLGEFIPLRRRQQFVQRDQFATFPDNTPIVDDGACRADQATAADQDAIDRYER